MRSKKELPQGCVRLLNRKRVSQQQFDLIMKVSLTGDFPPQLSARLEALRPWEDMFDTLLEEFAQSDVRWQVSENISCPAKPEPPRNPAFLFYLFLDAKTCDAVVGDLEERYTLILKKFGRRRANFWYWTQTVMSLGPFLWAWAKRIVLKPVLALVGWAVAKGLLDHDSWLAAVVTLYWKVKS